MCSLPFSATHLTLSPDNKSLYFIASEQENNFAASQAIYRYDLKSAKRSRLTQDIECNVTAAGDSRFGRLENPLQFLNSKELLFNLNAEGRANIHSLNVETGDIKALTQGDRVISAFSYANKRLAYCSEDPLHAAEVFSLAVRESGQERPHSRANKAFFKRYTMGTVSKEQRVQATADAPEVACWQVFPKEAREDKAMVLQIHGGPHTNYGYGFYLEFHLLAAQGYRVVYGNPRGSSSYGSDFRLSVLGNYGGIDADDVMAVVDAAQSQNPDAPIHITGGSYGGFMTNWLIGHYPKRFRSAVTQRSIANWTSFVGSSDIGYIFSPLEQGTTPWDDPQALWQQSPLAYVNDIETPLLIVHAEKDFRCPIEQAEQLFVALKSLGKEVAFVRFPDEGHELSRSGRPDRRIERLEAIVKWLGEHP